MLKRLVRRRLVVGIAAIVVALAAFRRALDQSGIIRVVGGVAPPRASPGSVVSDKPVPVSPGFQGCPPTGDGGDRELNYLKNRVDSASWAPTAFATVLDLRWSPSVIRRFREAWSRRDSVSVAEDEGLPVAVEGYFVAGKLEGPEATNCHGADATFRDWHLWLSATPGKDRSRSIVVETTPAVRANHPEWSLNAIHKLVRDSTLVRVSGWLMLDPEHPEQLGKTRGTLWEIHPVMKVEMLRDGRWTDLSAKALTDTTSE
ncbi:MAG TPA: hypothetical protein VGH98_01000 [Gemmatimonadaceae bacterium]|jgi:hypothetical protein